MAKVFLVVTQVVGNSLKSLEVSEEKANQRVEEFKRQLKSLTLKLKEAENRAELAEKTVKKLQKEVDRLEGRFFGFSQIVSLSSGGFRLLESSVETSKLYTIFYIVSSDTKFRDYERDHQTWPLITFFL